MIEPNQVIHHIRLDMVTKLLLLGVVVGLLANAFGSRLGIRDALADAIDGTLKVELEVSGDRSNPLRFDGDLTTR